MKLRGRRERRLLPPYRGCDEAADALTSVLLRADTSEVEPGATYRDAQASLRSLEIVLEPRLDSVSAGMIADAAGVPATALALVISGRSSFLKWEDELSATRLSEPLDPVVLSADPRHRVLRTTRTGFDIVASIVVLDEQPREPRTAWQKGSVLASTSFKVRPLSDFGFQPAPLTDDVRAAHGIPEATSRFFLFTGSPEPWEAAELDEVLTAYVDESALLLMGGTSRVRKEMQAELAATVYASVFQRCAAAKDELTDDIDESLIAQMCEHVDRALEKPSGTTLDHLRSGNAELAIAYVDAMAGLRDAFVQVLKGADADGV